MVKYIRFLFAFALLASSSNAASAQNSRELLCKEWRVDSMSMNGMDMQELFKQSYAMQYYIANLQQSVTGFDSASFDESLRPIPDSADTQVNSETIENRFLSSLSSDISSLAHSFDSLPDSVRAVYNAEMQIQISKAKAFIRLQRFTFHKKGKCVCVNPAAEEIYKGKWRLFDYESKLWMNNFMGSEVEFIVVDLSSSGMTLSADNGTLVYYLKPVE